MDDLVKNIKDSRRVADYIKDYVMPELLEREDYRTVACAFFAVGSALLIGAKDYLLLKINLDTIKEAMKQ